MSRLDLIKNNYSYPPVKYNFFFNNPQFDDIHPHVKKRLHIIMNPNQNPGSAHEMMFVTYIERLGREQHRLRFLKKAKEF